MAETQTKVRIFALAKELGLDSKVLIEHASAAGIEVKNSALASVTEDERDRIVAHIQQQGPATSGGGGGPLAPTREPPPDRGAKIRQIPIQPRARTMSSRPTPAPVERQAERAGRSTAGATATAEAPPTDSATSLVEEAHTEEAEQPRLSRTEVEASAETATPTEETGGAAVDEAAATDAGAAREAEAGEAGPGDTQPGSSVSGKSEGPTPFNREDYVSPLGGSSGGIREMKARGTLDNESRQSSRPAKPAKSKRDLPNIAAPPTFKPPKRPKPAAKDEGPAQKPDMRLTPEILQGQSPLGGHMRKEGQPRPERRVAKGGKTPTDLREARRRGMAEEDEPARKKKRARDAAEESAKDRRRGGRRAGRSRRSGPVVYQTSAEISLPITVRGLSEAMGRPAKELLSILFQRGEMAKINDQIGEETAMELALELGVDLEIKRGRDLERELARRLEEAEGGEDLPTRPPIVTILGHVDHGKTSLLDKLRSASVAAGEAGGITQHIASYQVEHEGKKIAFVDTPGHAAFGEMRARGANVTDIVVLVVAADDGVMPQTEECISHAKAAGVPIIVAMNKIDLPDADQQKTLQSLAAKDVLPAEWGGDVEVVRTSAMTGQGLDDLLETILLTAELQDYRTAWDAPALGVCLEAFRNEGRGVVAWLIVQTGMLRVGDVVLCGQAYGRIRAIYNDRDEEIQEAPPSTPVKVAGLDIMPDAGDHFFVMSDIDEARELAESRRDAGRAEVLAGKGRPRTMDDILQAARGGSVEDLPLIIKADTPGSLEALRGEIDKFDHPEVRVEVVHQGVGGVNESDVTLASASGAIIVAFHVVPEERASLLAEREGIEIRRYDIIYEVTEHIKNALEGLLKPERVVVPTGRAIVLQTFSISRFGTIAGCRVLNGSIERSSRVNVIRDQTVLNNYGIASLRREKDDVREVVNGMECGIRLEGFNDVKEGDILEAFRIEEKKRTLS
ncbi:MAG: translation initiation factor IF-2 [Planctomycetaceae bacterium]